MGITPLQFPLHSAADGRTSTILSATHCCWLAQGDSAAEGNTWRVTVLRNRISLSSNRLVLICLPTSTKKKESISRVQINYVWIRRGSGSVCFLFPVHGGPVLHPQHAQPRKAPAPAESALPSTKQPDQCLARAAEVPPCTTCFPQFLERLKHPQLPSCCALPVSKNSQCEGTSKGTFQSTLPKTQH